MPIVDEVQRVVEKGDDRFSQSQSLKRLQAYYEEMLRKGLVQKPRYSIPLPDTIGFNLK